MTIEITNIKIVLENEKINSRMYNCCSNICFL